MVLGTWPRSLAMLPLVLSARYRPLLFCGRRGSLDVSGFEYPAWAGSAFFPVPVGKFHGLVLYDVYERFHLALP